MNAPEHPSQPPAGAAAAAAAAACQYPSWYPQYTRHAIKSVLIPVPASFEHFLQEDGIVLEDDTPALPTRGRPPVVTEIDSSDDESPAPNGTHHTGALHHDNSASDSDSNTSSSTEALPWSERCPEVTEQITAALQQVGGAVAPALNWSSPSDATWISSNKNLKCQSADEVLVLLKSSDRVQHDLDLLQQLRTSTTSHQLLQPASATATPAATTASAATSSNPATTSSSSNSSHPAVLVLREWYDLRPECELRCYVHQHRVVAVSQRDVSQHFPQLQGRQQQLAAAAVAAHTKCIGSSFHLDAYAVDLYLAPSGAVRLLNFNPICSTTSPLLFSWDELPYVHMRSSSSSPAPAAGVGSSSSSSSGAAGDAEGSHDRHQLRGVAAGADGNQAGASTMQLYPPTAEAEASAVVEGRGVNQGTQQQQQQALPECRLIEQPGLVQAGNVAATGMPYDMLHMQDSLDAIIGAMQRQQLSES